MKFSEKVGNGPMNKWLNFGGNPDPDHDTGKTCLGGGMHCPSASSSFFHCVDLWNFLKGFPGDVLVFNAKCLLFIALTFVAICVVELFSAVLAMVNLCIQYLSIYLGSGFTSCKGWFQFTKLPTRFRGHSWLLKWYLVGQL